MQRVVIIGGSGFIGKRLVEYLIDQGYEVVVLTRKHIEHKEGSPVRWLQYDPLMPMCFFNEGDWVINLAGESISKKWTRINKEKILKSRIQVIWWLKKSFELGDTIPKVVFCASATGYYRYGDEPVDESGRVGNSFPSMVSEKVEACAFEELGSLTRLVIGRFGVVLGKESFLKEIVRTIKMGMGVSFGNGMQYLPWIHIEDACRAINEIMEVETYLGAVNLVAPEGTRFKEFFTLLGKIKKIHIKMEIPEFFAKAAFGEMSELLLKGTYVVPKKLLDSGFNFKFKNIESALEDLLDS